MPCPVFFLLAMRDMVSFPDKLVRQLSFIT